MSEDFLYRKVRYSRDWRSWLGLVLSMFPIVFGFVGFSLTSTGERMLCGLLLALFFVSLFWFLKCLIFPFQWELVVENERIRWGKVDRPDRQKQLAVSQLARLIDDKSDNQVLADIGKIVLLPIGDNVLVRPDDRKGFVECMRQNFPWLKIETL